MPAGFLTSRLLPCALQEGCRPSLGRDDISGSEAGHGRSGDPGVKGQTPRTGPECFASAAHSALLGQKRLRLRPLARVVSQQGQTPCPLPIV